jgi:hypothetical protein
MNDTTPKELVRAYEAANAYHADRHLMAAAVNSNRWPAAYQSGFHGAYLRNQGPQWQQTIAQYEFERFIDEAQCETDISAALPSSLQSQWKDQRAVHWNWYLELDPQRSLRGSQDYGNCTAWSLREIVGCEWATDIKARGEAQEYTRRPGTAVPYASRGHGGQGSALSTLVNVVHRKGVQVEQVYCDGKYDLSTESADEAAGNRRFGMNGPPTCILDEIAEDRIEQVSHVPDPEAALDVLAAGHFCFHGSTLTGQSSGDPVSGIRTIGGHAQAVIGYDDTDEFREWYREKTGRVLTEAVVIHDQSWGQWNQLTNWPEHLWGVKPQGAWVITLSSFSRIVDQWGDCYAISNVLGFPLLELPDWGSGEYL